MTAPQFDVTAFLGQDEGQHFDRKPPIGVGCPADRGEQAADWGESGTDRGEQELEGEIDTPQVTPQVDREIKSFTNHELRDLATGLGLPTPQVTPQVATQISRILEAVETAPRARDELQRAAELSDREHFRKAYLEPLIGAGWLERTIPEKPTSRLQKYRLAEGGEAWLARRRRGGPR